MEMEFSQVDAVRRLNVSRCVVPRLWNEFQTTDSVSRRLVSGQQRVTTPAEDRYLAFWREEEESLLSSARCR